MNLAKQVKKPTRLKPIKESRTLEIEYYKELSKLARKLKSDVRERVITQLRGSEVVQDDTLGLLATFEALNNEWSGLQLGSLATNITTRVNQTNKQRFLTKVNQATGIDMEALIREENLDEFVALQRRKQEVLIKSIPTEFLKDVEVIVTNGLANGLRPEEIARQLSGIKDISSSFGKLENRVKMIARNEISTMNGALTKARAEANGVTKAVWSTSGDERVRDSHADRDGKEYDLSKGCYSSLDGKWLQAGQDFNCRCVMELIIE